MTAISLQTELNALLQESKKKQPQLRVAAEASLTHLKNADKGPENLLATNLKSKPFFQLPFLIACKSKVARISIHGALGIQRLVGIQAVPDDGLQECLEALRECSSTSSELQMKVLQILPGLISNYSVHITGQTLVVTFQLAIQLHESRSAAIANTAAAILQQLVSVTFEKLECQSPQKISSGKREVAIDAHVFQLQDDLFDAFCLINDLCLMVAGREAFYIAESLSKPASGLDILNFILTQYGPIVRRHPEYLELIEVRLIDLVVQSLSQNTQFSEVARFSRICQSLLLGYASCFLNGAETCMTLISHLLEDTSNLAWKRALCIEIYCNIFSDIEAITTLFYLYDLESGRKNLVTDCLGTLVRVALENPVIIALGSHTSFALSDAAAEDDELPFGSIGFANTPGIGAWSRARIPCLDLLDRDEPPQICATYIYSMVLTCICRFLQILADQILLYSIHLREASRAHAIPGLKLPRHGDLDGEEEEAIRASEISEHFMQSEPLFSTLRQASDPLGKKTFLAAMIIDQTWPALLAASNPFFRASLDKDFYWILVRSYQKVAQAAGLLRLSEPYQAFVTALANAAIPNIATRQAPAAQSDMNHRAIQDERLMMIRHLSTVSAILYLAIALGSSADQSWAIIISTIVRTDAEIFQAHDRPLDLKGSETSSADNARSSSNDLSEELEDQHIAVEKAVRCFFSNTRNIHEKAFCNLVQSFRSFLVTNEKTVLKTTTKTPEFLAPTSVQRKHVRNPSVSGAMLNSGSSGPESLLLLAYYEVLLRANLSRLIQCDEAASEWQLCINLLMDNMSATINIDQLRLRAATSLCELLFESIKVGNAMSSPSKYIIVQRSLTTILCSIEKLAEESSTTNTKARLDKNYELHLIFFRALREILEYCGDAVRDRWEIVFEILLKAFQPLSDSHTDFVSPVIAFNQIEPEIRSLIILESSFSSLELICADFLDIIEVKSFIYLVNVLALFCAQTTSINMSLTAQAILQGLSQHLLSSSLLEEGPPARNTGRELDMSQSTLSVQAWKKILATLARASCDHRGEIRSSALQTLFRVLKAGNDHLSNSSFLILFNIIFQPLLLTLHGRCKDQLYSQTQVSTPHKDEWVNAVCETISEICGTLESWASRLGTNDDAEELYLLFLKCLGPILSLKHSQISLNIFRNLSKLFYGFAAPHEARETVLTEFWRIWLGSSPTGLRLPERTGRTHELRNDSVVAYWHCFSTVFEINSQDMRCLHLPDVLANLREALIGADPYPSTTQKHKLTTVHEAGTRALRLITSKVTHDNHLLTSLCDFIALVNINQDCKDSAKSSHYAWACECMILLEQYLKSFDHKTSQNASSWLIYPLKILADTIDLKFRGTSAEDHVRLVWRQATSTTVAVARLGHSQFPSFVQMPDFWNTFRHILSSVVVEPHSSDSLKTFDDDEQFDIQAFTSIWALLLPHLQSNQVDDHIRESFCNLIFQRSMIQESHSMDLDIDYQNPLKFLDHSRPGTVRFIPARPRARVAYILLDKLFEMAAPDVDGKHELLARIAAPRLLVRVGCVFKDYTVDQPLRGRMPLPTFQRSEMIYIAEKLSDLRVEASAFPRLRHTRTNDRIHLYYLYPLILKASNVAYLDDQLNKSLRKVLKLLGDEVMISE